VRPSFNGRDHRAKVHEKIGRDAAQRRQAFSNSHDERAALCFEVASSQPFRKGVLFSLTEVYTNM